METVVITTRSFSSGGYDAIAQLEEAGYRVERADPSHDIAALQPILAEAVGWIVGTGPVGDEHLDAAPHLRVMARYGVGIDNLDLAAAHRRGIVVTNTPEANSDSVADHTMALLLALLRRVVPADRAARAGARFSHRSRELGALVTGVVGFGAIGRRVVARLVGFGTKVMVADPYADPEQIGGRGATPATLDELAGRCDVVTLHAPGDMILIDAEWLQRCRPGVLLVNTSRAGLIDEASVLRALRDGRVGGLAADAFAGDDRGETSAYAAHDLADRVVLTPHVATHTRDAVDRMSQIATDEVLTVLAGSPPHHPVVTKETP